MSTGYSAAVPDDTALIDLLSSERPEDVAMAQALLMERIHDEVKLPTANQEMIPSLLEKERLRERATGHRS